jgi:outer membrane protein OmpA-like peptidoglycan-associated protein
MESIMKMKHYAPMTLIAIAVIGGCSTAPKNPSLVEAHNNYNNARNSAEITNQAALELRDAGVSLKRADEAFDEEEGDQIIDHLAYVANQQVSIARETAKRKTSELAVASSEAKRDKVRLDARTNEADSAERQVTQDKAVIEQQAILINDLNAKKTERGFMITLGDVLFRTNKAQLESGGIRNVEKLGSFLNQYPNYKVLIEGYTDSTGRHEYNQELSDRRANSVRRALVDMGISGDRIQAEGYAEDYPVASNATASNRQLNRRVEIVLSDSNGNITPR